MDISRFQSGIESISHCGITLSTEKYVLLRNSLVVLQNDNHFKKTFFWGIIYGIVEDYHIAFGYEKDALVGKIFYYSVDCKNWQLLPQPKPEHFTFTSICTGRFQGDSGFIYILNDDAPPPEDSGIENVEEEEKTKQSISLIEDNQLKEEDRLAATIYMINEEASIVPRGSLFLREDGVNIHSLAFEGIKLEEWDELRNYQHYRVPQEKWNENILSRSSYNYAVDFLDTIASDIPSECWSAQLVDGERILILQSLYWTGFIFYHTLETRDHGFIYSGFGKKNLDIPFMQRVVTDDRE